MFFKNKKLIALLVLLVSTLFFLTSYASEEPVFLVFSTHSVGTGMYMTSAALVPIVESLLPSGSRIDVETTGGGVSGPMLVGTGQVDISLGNTITVRQLYDGVLEGQPKVDGMRSIGGGLDTPMSTIIFTEDFIRRTGFTSIAEIVENKYPVRIAIKPVGSLGEQIANMTFEAYGATLDEVVSWGGEVHRIASGDIPAMLSDNRADITLDHVGQGQAATSELAMSTPIRFISLSDSAQDVLVEQGFARFNMPAGTWPKQDYEVRGVSAASLLLVNKDMSDDIAYIITKALIENKDEMVKTFAGMEDFDPSTAWKPDKVQAPLHPGAERYYREFGLME
jgi:TRAP transporter TAXI family solute receptor